MHRAVHRIVVSATFALIVAFAVTLWPWLGQPASPAQAQFQFGGCLQFGGFNIGGFNFGQFGGSCSFGGGGGFNNFGFNFGGGSNLGSFRVLAPSASVGVDDRLPIVFGWEVPQSGVWRDLKSLEIRFKESSGDVALWLLWDQSSDSIGIVGPNTERVSDTERPGQKTVLESSDFKLFLADSATQSTGPTGQVVAILLSISPKPSASGETYSVEVRARNDAGSVQGFTEVGTLSVNGDDDDEDRKRLTKEEREQRRRGNTLGRDSLRAEGNVVAPPHCSTTGSAPLTGVPEWLTEEPGPWVIYADRDGLKRGDLRGEAQTACESIRAGDYITGSGSESSDREFEFESISVEGPGSPRR